MTISSKLENLIRICRLILLVLSLIIGNAYAQKREFEFSSGGAYHPEGFGEWIVTLDTVGNFSIAHNVRGEVKEFEVFSLAQEDNSFLWELIRSIDIEKMGSSKRSGQPDEAQYTFVLRDEVKTYTVNIWINDTLKDKKIASLVNRIATLIEQHTGEKPVFK